MNSSFSDDYTLDDHPTENCGVFGAFSRSGRDVSDIAITSQLHLKHRGQESYGIAIDEDGVPEWIRKMGPVSLGYTSRQRLQLRGSAAIAHVRYSTAGTNDISHAQPFCFAQPSGKKFYLSHNGNIRNAGELRK